MKWKKGPIPYNVTTVNTHIEREPEEEEEISTQDMIRDARSRRNMRDRYKCDECGFKTTSDYVLKRHTQVSHESKNKDKDIKSKRKICNECGKRFNKESTYRTHVRTMHGGETNDGGTNNLVENSKSN